ncbi:hypothetical protein PV327_000153, partial [Microctonus hyperodae]
MRAFLLDTVKSGEPIYFFDKFNMFGDKKFNQELCVTANLSIHSNKLRSSTSRIGKPVQTESSELVALHSTNVVGVSLSVVIPEKVVYVSLVEITKDKGHGLSGK